MKRRTCDFENFSLVAKENFSIIFHIPLPISNLWFWREFSILGIQPVEIKSAVLLSACIAVIDAPTVKDFDAHHGQKVLIAR